MPADFRSVWRIQPSKSAGVFDVSLKKRTLETHTDTFRIELR